MPFCFFNRGPRHDAGCCFLVSVKALSAVWDYSRARGVDLLVLLAMADWADHHGRCYPSYSQIAGKARVSRASVASAIARLIDLGELERTSKGHAPPKSDDEPPNIRRQYRNSYRILLINKHLEVVQPLDYFPEISESLGKEVVQPLDQEVVQTPDYLKREVVQTPDGGSPVAGLEVVQSTRSHIRIRPSVQPSIDRQKQQPTKSAAAARAKPTRTTDEEQIKNLWNQMVTHPLKPVSFLTLKRIANLRAALARHPLDKWQDIISRVETSSFCRGGGDRGWVASFDWLIGSDDAVVKILEGRYDESTTRQAFSAAELTAAAAHRARVTMGRCTHDPTCADKNACIIEWAISLRGHASSA